MKHRQDKNTPHQTNPSSAPGGELTQQSAMPPEHGRIPPPRSGDQTHRGRSWPRVDLRFPLFGPRHRRWRVAGLVLALIALLLCLPIIQGSPNESGDTGNRSPIGVFLSFLSGRPNGAAGGESGETPAPDKTEPPESPTEPLADTTDEATTYPTPDTGTVEATDAIEDTDSEPEPPDTTVPADADILPDTTAPVETTPPPPPGAIPIVSVDVSESDRGAASITNTGSPLPGNLPTLDTVWPNGRPTILLVTSHPFEGFGSGASWYHPAEGILAGTSSTDAPDGVVALARQLAKGLRAKGFSVLQICVPATPDESVATVYDRTEALLRRTLLEYPMAALVLDLRRSAELTAEGSILRTAGQLEGEACAQLRFSLGTDRPLAATARDLAVALALRGVLWEHSETLSRPVWAKSGPSLGEFLENGEIASDPVVLTLEIGSAGNTFAEAECTIAPLINALASVLPCP